MTKRRGKRKRKTRKDRSQKKVYWFESQFSLFSPLWILGFGIQGYITVPNQVPFLLFSFFFFFFPPISRCSGERELTILIGVEHGAESDREQNYRNLPVERPFDTNCPLKTL